MSQPVSKENYSAVILFQRLPIVIFHEIRAFLVLKEYLKFLNASKEFSSDMKRESCLYVLSEKNTLRFFKDSIYKESILQKIIDPRRQLHLQFPYDHVKGCDSTYLHQILTQPSYKIVVDGSTLHEVPDWSSTLMLHSQLIFTNGNLVISSFEGMCKEQSAKMILHLNNFRALKDVSGLQYLQTLVLNDCVALQDVRCLGTVQNLTLRYCPGITDVSALGQVKSLTLESCGNIVDLSGLTHNVSLCIVSCKQIQITTLHFPGNCIKSFTTDIFLTSMDFLFETSSLESLTLFSYYGTPPAQAFIAPSSVRVVTLKNSALSGRSFNLISFHLCQQVILCGIIGFIDLSPLYSVPFVELESINNLQQVSCDGLGGNRKVSLVKCENIRNYSALKTVPKLFLNVMKGLNNPNVILNCFAHCDELILISCRLSSFQHLGRIKDLTIISCYIESSSTAGLGISNQKITFEKEYFHFKEGLEERGRNSVSSLFSSLFSFSSTSFTSFWKENYFKEVDGTYVIFTRKPSTSQPPSSRSESVEKEK